MTEDLRSDQIVHHDYQTKSIRSFMNGYMDKSCQGNTYSLFKGKIPHSQQHPLLTEQPWGSHSLFHMTLRLKPGAMLIKPQVGCIEADPGNDNVVWFQKLMSILRIMN